MSIIPKNIINQSVMIDQKNVWFIEGKVWEVKKKGPRIKFLNIFFHVIFFEIFLSFDNR